MALERLDAKQLALKSLRQRVLFIDDEVVSESRNTVMLDVLEESKRIRIRQGPVFSETLAIVSALDIMKPTRITTVMAGKNSALCVDLTTKRIPAAFPENLVEMLLRMVSPD